jgi:hypothetical protein
LLWAVILLLLGTRHPLIYDFTELDRRRKFLAALALLMFVLSFMVAPIETHWGD